MIITKGPFWEVRALAESESAEVMIYGVIGESWDGSTVAARELVAELSRIKADYLTVRINSYGGAVADGLAIYNALRRHPAAVTVEVDAIAASIASLIAMAGDTVRMAANAQLMIHAPWGFAMGNAGVMRDMAEVLDRYARAMHSSYLRPGVDPARITAWLEDGADHWLSAKEAIAAGLADEMTAALAIAAAAHDHDRYRGRAAASPQESMMADTTDTPAAQTTDNIAAIAAAAEKKAREALAERNRALRTRFDGFARASPGRLAEIRAIYDEALADFDADVESFTVSVLAKLGADCEPVAGASAVRVSSVADAREKLREGAAAALAARMTGQPLARGNEYRGMALHEIAAACLKATGEDPRGLTRTELAGRVLAAHTTSDFPYLLADSARKSLQAAYEAFPSTWSMIAARGEVSDFKTISMVRLGSFNSLDTIPEGAEYTAGTLGEEREQLTAVTKGKFIQLSRQMIINDDLNGFARMSAMLGRAAARTVNKDVYTVLNANGLLSDSVALFATAKGNLASSGAAISVATLGAGRAAMRKQLDPNGNDYLNIMPRTLLVPVALEDHARAVVTSTEDTDTAGARKRNPIRDWGPLDVVSDPYLDAASTTAWYMVADPLDVPLLEVRFLDGNSTPYIDDDMEFLTDAIRWKVRLDYGVAANDRRGGYKNAGAGG